MTKPILMASVALVALIALAPAGAWPESAAADKARAQAPIPFAAAEIRFEKNATDNDLGIQVDLDAEAWRSVEIYRPDGRKMFDVKGKGPLKRLGLTELFFESEEPSLDEVPLERLLAMFPEGEYRFVGRTVEGQRIRSTATLTHDIPDGPVIVSPAEDEVVDSTQPVVIDWDAVTNPAGIVIVEYQVIVEGGATPRVFSVRVPATTTSVTVPPEFLEPGSEYTVEVLAIEVSGNQTITEISFETE